MKCEKCHDSGFYGDNGPGRKGNTEYTRCECQEDMPCTTHHACECVIFALHKVIKFYEDDIDAGFMRPQWLVDALNVKPTGQE